MRYLQVQEIRCKHLLHRTNASFAEWTLNPYIGCGFGCSYCYVPVLRAKRGQEGADTWGNWVQVKVNAPDVIRREMLDVPRDAHILIGSATDAWQPIEKRYCVSRGVLYELSFYPNKVTILTRSPLLIRDIDLLKRFEQVSVHISVPTVDEKVRRVFEPYAPSVAGRIRLTHRLLEAGIRATWAWCPFLPGVENTSEQIRRYVQTAAQAGVREIWVGRINYWSFLEERYRALLRKYRAQAGWIPHLLLREETEQLVREECEKSGIVCRI
ncbi:MAG: radical SAM protein [Armatimonadota bacterium]|nr:radical SAM protein [bacterium]MDW8322009.1 radical SAM protein [Armatimonadota bacterium]